MRAAVVLNSTAGADVGQSTTADQVLACLRAAGLDAELAGRPDNSLPEKFEAAVASRPDVVVVGGGDGSIACAAQRLKGQDIPLGIIPLGTMNLMAKDLGLPLELEGAVSVIAASNIRRIDVGVLNGHVFLCKAMVGLPANIAQLREHGRGKMNARGWLRLLRHLAVGLNRYPLLSMALLIDGQTKRVRTRAIAVSCNAYDEGFGRVLRRSHLDRGELVLYIPHGLTLWKLLRLGAGLATGTWQKQEGLESHPLKELEVLSPRKLLRAMLDGEVRLLETPLRFSVEAGALRVMAPLPIADTDTPAATEVR
ncbi:diacylglycerol/lipid kinase family protein [Terrihabitans rhizophilus]|jgi:diacylglycerol kinase family enzyme|uniref:Diacylglycerol kinase family protein n=1 Tax=Terrihabitans rhizophilus TaxID=3092662 RepID=A0ABU4RWM0_9HYPH|nr:diacylglycerol kinase family protein [Terrihabitans sp. PJ23]MDX6807286.1 diacylglycerol kinase family protein [Terrihabitans sp. PJ23]